MEKINNLETMPSDYDVKNEDEHRPLSDETRDAIVKSLRNLVARRDKKYDNSMLTDRYYDEVERTLAELDRLRSGEENIVKEDTE